MTKRVQLTGKQVIQVAATSETDTRTVRRYAAGKATKPAKGAAIAAALRSLGLALVLMVVGCDDGSTHAPTAAELDGDPASRGRSPALTEPDAGTTTALSPDARVGVDSQPDARPAAQDTLRVDVQPAPDLRPAQADAVILRAVESVPECTANVVSNIAGNCPTAENGLRYQMFPFSGLDVATVYRCMRCADHSGRALAVPALCRAEAQGGGVQPVFPVVCVPDGTLCADVCVPGEYL